MLCYLTKLMPPNISYLVCLMSKFVSPDNRPDQTSAIGKIKGLQKSGIEKNIHNPQVVYFRVTRFKINAGDHGPICFN
jgi:hypothetical protein